VHREPGRLAVFAAFTERHGLPLRDRHASHNGGFYGAEAVTVARLLGLLEGIDEDVSELGCHPGYADGLRSAYTT